MDVKLFGALSITTLLCAPSYANLVFTEYIEGSGSNKAIEVSNLGAADVDLSTENYSIRLFANGRAIDDPNNTQQLTGVLAAGHSLVFVNGSAEQQLVDKGVVSSITFFNGDDALGLFSSEILIDSIGQIGVDPGSTWFSNGVSTQNQSLRRFDTSADIDPTQAFDPSQKWQSFGLNDFSGLGCSGVDVCELDDQTDPVIDIGACYDDATPIHVIQGSSDTSPLEGETHIVEAIVSASFQADGQLSGFFLIEEDSEHDANSLTSEGLFVYDSNFVVEAGDQVRLLGQVAEYYGNTQISDVQDLVVCSTQNAFSPTYLELPLAQTNLSHLDGMYLVLPQSLHVGLDYNFNRYGTASLSLGKRYTPTELFSANSEDAIALDNYNARNVIGIDDGSTAQNPETIAYFPNLAASNTLRSGALVKDVEGPLQLSFGEYRIQLTQTLNVIDGNQRPIPAQVSNESAVSVASFNVLNYFSDIDTGGTSFRGADSELELERQQAKIVTAILQIDADIVGLMEIQNNGFGEGSAIKRLVEALNSELDSPQHYQFVQPANSELVGDDAIAVGIIYQPSRVSTDGDAQLTTVYPFDAQTAKHRVPLGQRFISASGETLTVVVNHFKSKGSSCDDLGDPNNNDGQGNCNGQRVLAALALIEAYADQENVLLIGDFNAYSAEDPMQTFSVAGFESLAKLEDSQSYSYYFDELAGSLDHALASEDLQARSISATVWHSNADEPRGFDYNTEFKSEQQLQNYYDTSPYRASDHDAVLVYLNMDSSGKIEFSPRVEVAEGQSVDVPVYRNAGSYGRIELAYSIEAITADASDLSLGAGTLTWEDGDSDPLTIQVDGLQDQLVEGVELAQIVFEVIEGDVQLNLETLEIAIQDVIVEPSITLEQAQYRVDESQGVLAIPVSLNVETDKGAKAYVLVLPRTANWRDYKARFIQKVSWSAGQSGQQFVKVRITDDRRREAEENFKVMLIWSRGAQIGEISQSLVHIIDND